MEPSTPLPTYTIVIAKYKEDISWIEELQKENIVIYDKSGEQNPNPPIGIKQYMQRPNIGREGETFLYYILMNYDNLTDYIVFLQGNPFDHTGEINTPKKLQNKINDHIQQQNIQIFGFGQFISNYEYYYNMRFQDYCNLLFDNQNYSTICGFNAGCQYIIPKEYILSRPKQFYSRLYSMIINTPEYITYDMIHNGGIYNPNFITGWCLERFFALVFGFKNIPANPRFIRKRVLVTGGSGFIGSNLVKRLISKDYHVTVIDNLSTGNGEYLAGISDEDMYFIKGDILDPTIYDRVGFVDGIFHLAAMSKVLPSLANRDMAKFCLQQNVEGTIAVLNYAASLPIPPKVVYSASSTYYGNENPIPHTEIQLPDCQTPYALSKYCGELYCKLYSDLYGVPSVRLRYFMVYGENEPSEGAYAIVTGIFKRNIKNGKPIEIHGTGEQTRDFVWVGDVCEANIRAMESSHLTNDTMNVGTGEMVSIKELANLVCPDTSKHIYTEARKIDLKATLCNTEQLESKMGWRPKTKICEFMKANLNP